MGQGLLGDKTLPAVHKSQQLGEPFRCEVLLHRRGAVFMPLKLLYGQALDKVMVNKPILVLHIVLKGMAGHVVVRMGLQKIDL